MFRVQGLGLRADVVLNGLMTRRGCLDLGFRVGKSLLCLKFRFQGFELLFMISEALVGDIRCLHLCNGYIS